MECPKCNSTKTIKKGYSVLKGIRSQNYLCRSCGYCWRDYDKNATSFRRVIFIQDTHCGHLTGLTSPEYNDKTKEYYDFRTESWNWFNNVIERMKPFDYCVYNGDLIDGRQVKSGGMELLTNDRLEQVRMAVAIHNKISPVRSVVIRGSKYHVGKEENFEDDFADRIGAKVYDRFLGDIAGKVFDIRHKIGRSSVPSGRLNPLSRQIVWSRLRDERNGVKADVIVRAHVHYSVYVEESGIIAFTTPALQGHSVYGAQECDGEIDYGLRILDIYPDGRVVPHLFLPELETLKPKIIEL